MGGIFNGHEDDVQYLAVGHIAKDITASGYVSGGAVYYGSVTAAKLGLKPAVLTSCSPDFSFPSELENYPVRVSVSSLTTTFENIYTGASDSKDRLQYVHDIADPISLAVLPEAWTRVPILHLAPLLDEIPIQIIDKFPDSLVVASIQGWTRRVGENGRVYADKWDGTEFLPGIDVAICSEQDAYDVNDISRWRKLSTVLIVTNGRYGARIYSDECNFKSESISVTEVDPTGAGDVFAAAFAVRFFETTDLQEASDFASVVAGFSVKSQGVSEIPSRRIVNTFREKLS